MEEFGKIGIGGVTFFFFFFLRSVVALVIFKEKCTYFCSRHGCVRI